MNELAAITDQSRALFADVFRKGPIPDNSGLMNWWRGLG
jgi:hypothetical protein